MDIVAPAATIASDRALSLATGTASVRQTVFVLQHPKGDIDLKLTFGNVLSLEERHLAYQMLTQNRGRAARLYWMNLGMSSAYTWAAV